MRSVRLPPRRQLSIALLVLGELAFTVVLCNSYTEALNSSAVKLADLITRHGEYTRVKSGRCDAHRWRQDHHQFCERCTEHYEIFGKKLNGQTEDEMKTEMIIVDLMVNLA